MTAKNFLTDGKIRGDRSLWLLGAAALAVCAFLAAGLIVDKDETRAPELATAQPVDGQVSLKEGATEDADPKVAKQGGWRSKRTAKMPKGPGVGSIWKTMGGLVVVLVLVFALAIFCSRLLKKVRMRPQGDKVLELIDVIPLGPKKQVFVLSAYGRKLIVGATADSMNVLSEFAADEIEAGEAIVPESFSEKLTKNMARHTRPLSTMELEA